MAVKDPVPTAYPVGRCYCGCGEAVRPAQFWIGGHDKVAEARVISEVYGSVASFVLAHGYGPDGPKAG